MNKTEGFNFLKALQFLEQKSIVYCVDRRYKIYFKQLNRLSILIKTNNFTSKINLEDFKKLFSKTMFFLLEFSEENPNNIIDSSRDIEYYSWKHK